MIENGKFDYMQPSAECYRKQMLKSVEKFGDGPFDYNNHTHVCCHKVHFVNKMHPGRYYSGVEAFHAHSD